jgi:hypothetical protein
MNTEKKSKTEYGEGWDDAEMKYNTTPWDSQNSQDFIAGQSMKFALLMKQGKEWWEAKKIIENE